MVRMVHIDPSATYSASRREKTRSDAAARRQAEIQAQWYTKLTSNLFKAPALCFKGEFWYIFLNGFTCLKSGKVYGALTVGVNVLAVVYTLAWFLSFKLKYLNLGWVYDNFCSLLTASTVLTYFISTALYAASFIKGKILAKGGDSGYPLYDFWMGRELNPRIGQLDLKEVFELYPGLIFWTVANLSMAHKQKQILGHVTNGMLIVNAFQFLYVFDALWNERAILTTMDITTDGLGFMLTFGDLTWVPFMYSLQACYLVKQSEVRVISILVLKQN